MKSIEIKSLTKNFGEKQALKGLNMTVPVGSIYGFIGENGSGKSTTEKIICGLIHPSGGEVKLFGKDYTDADVRAKVGVLIEAPGCFANYSVWNNLMLQAANLSIKNPEEEIRKVLKLVRMEGAAGNKFKNCSLGMKQRIGIAMALLGDPELLVLDEPINGLDADGMRIMRVYIYTHIYKLYLWGFPGGPVVKKSPCNAGDAGLISLWETKITQATEQLNPQINPRVHAPQ